jgi:hypothetical protein
MVGQKGGVAAPPRGDGGLSATLDDGRREQFALHLEQILASSAFRNSRRYASVLRYVVERTLEGNTERLKERTIGVDVFGRPADYDTASDHAVRSAMAEVRKRLAQYYQDDGDTADLRIEIQPGSYVPQLRIAAPPLVATDPEPEAVETDPDLARPVTVPGPPRLRVLFLGAALAAAFAAALMIGFAVFASDPISEFWGPVFAAKSRILLCIGNLEGGRRPSTNAEPSGQPVTMRMFHVMPSQTVHIDDATTLARFAGLLDSHGKEYRIATQSEADFQDLRNGPAILIGLLNNDWTERLVGKLRFTVERPAPGKVFIRDSQQPSRTDWSMDYLTPVNEVTKDYALVVRALDPKTDQMVVMVGGISVFGTLAAGEFLTDARNLGELAAQAPRGWRQRNLEVVLSTDVIRGRSGRPKIIATHFW